MVGPGPQKAAKKRMPKCLRRTGNAGKNPQPTKMEKVEAGKRVDEKNDKSEDKSMLVIFFFFFFISVFACGLDHGEAPGPR